MFWERLFRTSNASLESRPSTPPVLPRGKRIYAIGDIHGRADLLLELRELIASDLAQSPIIEPLLVFLGDYIDRGPDSRQVLDLLVAQQFPAPIVPLMGNHEAMLLEFLEHPNTGELWSRYGGLQTLHSYGVNVEGLSHRRNFAHLAQDLAMLLPSSHLDFLRSLPAKFMAGDYFFCHAGARPGVPLEQQQQHDLIWIREEFTSRTHFFGKVIVHGHNPVLEPEELLNRVNVDTGAYLTNRLSCVVLEGTERRFLATVGDRARVLAAC